MKSLDIETIDYYEITIKDRNPNKYSNLQKKYKIVSNLLDHALQIAFIKARENGLNEPYLVAIVRSENIIFDVDEFKENFFILANQKGQLQGIGEEDGC